MAAPTVIAGFPAGDGNSYAFYDVDSYDGAKTYAPDLIEHDITSYCREQAGITVTRGVQQFVITGFAANAATLSCTLNNHDRRFDSLHIIGPYVDGGIVKVRPGVPILARATNNAVDYDLFTGTADGFPQQYPMNGTDQVVDLRATDSTALFAGADLTISRPAEYTGTRIAAIANAVGFTGARAISPGTTIVAALTRATVSAWSHMTDVANAEWGDLYFAKDGTLTFRDRDLIFSEARSTTSQATFGDQGTELRYSDVELGSPPIVNDVTVAYGTHGRQVNHANVASQRKYGRKSLNVAFPINDVEIARQYAGWLVTRYKDELTTFASITIAPSRGEGVTSGANNLFPQAFGRELGDRITVLRTPKGGGSRISKECFIRGISHQYSGGVWRSTKFTLQDAAFTLSLAYYDVTAYDDLTVYAA